MLRFNMKLLFIIITAFVVCRKTSNAYGTGPTGMPGDDGYGGAEGLKGDKGDIGFTGLRGEKGAEGWTGLPGQDGIPGRPGFRGIKGDKGEPGRDGFPASLLSVLDDENAAVVDKLRGLQGEIGPIGFTGRKGDQGDEGFNGEKGKKGDGGDRGVASEGAKGEPGFDGAPGDRGMPGAVGPQGPPGICVLGPSGHPEQLRPTVFLPTTATASTVPTSTIDAKYTLLKPPGDAELVDDSYTPGLSSYKFTSGEPVIVDPSATNLVGLNLSAPFIVAASFKSYSRQSVCLFSITQDEHTAMSLCMQPAAGNISRFTLFTELYSPKNSISFLINEDYGNKWTKIVLCVKDDLAALYVNGSKHSDTLTLLKDKDIPLTKDMKIKLAFSKSRRSKFEGLIEEISLYTNADDDTLLYVCDKARSIPSHYLSNFEEHEGNVSKNLKERRPQPLEFDFKKELAECHREITVIKEDMNNQIKNATLIMRNEIRQDIEDLKSAIEFLTEKLMDVLKSEENSKTELNVAENKNIDIEDETI